MYAFRTTFVVLRLVACGVSELNTTTLPARTGTSTAVDQSPQHSSPTGVERWARVPSRCTPGITATHPFSGVASVIASQHVRYACGSV